MLIICLPVIPGIVHKRKRAPSSGGETAKKPRTTTSRTYTRGIGIGPDDDDENLVYGTYLELNNGPNRRTQSETRGRVTFSSSVSGGSGSYDSKDMAQSPPGVPGRIWKTETVTVEHSDRLPQV